MTNSRATRGKLTLLDKHLATGTEADYTYTPANPLDMKGIYREIQVIYSGKATASLQIQLIVNTSTNYDTSEIKADSTVLSHVLGNAAGDFALIPAVLIDGAVSFHGKITLTLNDANDLLSIYSTGSADHEGTIIRTGEVQDSATTITSIKIEVSTSTWIAGTEISTYGLRR